MENRDLFNRIVKEALADGVITPQERELIIKSGKEIGLEENDINVLLEDLKKSSPCNDKPVRRIKTSELIHSRRLIEKTKLSDGRIQELWEYIDEELRPDTRENARPGNMLKIRTTKKVKKVYNAQSQAPTSVLSSPIKTITDINYTQTKKAIAVITKFAPIVNEVVPIICGLESASENYKKSKSPDRDTDFLIEIGKLSLVSSLPLIEKYVPYGNIVVSALRCILVTYNPLG